METRIKRLVKRAAYVTGVFLGFLGIFFSVSPSGSIHDPATALSSGALIAHAETPVESSYTGSYFDPSVGGDDDDCGGDAGGDADDSG